MKYFFLICFCVLAKIGNGQVLFNDSGFNTTLKESLVELEALQKSHQFLELSDGWTKPSAFLLKWNSIRLKLSTAELIVLTDHPEAGIRFIAFYTLAGMEREQGVSLVPIIEAHLSDTIDYNVIYGCQLFKGKMADIWIRLATFDTAEKRAMASLMFEKASYLESNREFAFYLESDPSHYESFFSKAKKGDDVALFGLLNSFDKFSKKQQTSIKKYTRKRLAEKVGRDGVSDFEQLRLVVWKEFLSISL